jgi:acetylornithine deacetylase/succinyl-diaminopimelate desuccinylase-like protein
MAKPQVEWESIFEEAIRNLSELIKFKTVNPPGNEKPATEFLADILAKNGIEPKLLESAPGRANVVARLKGTGEKAPVLLDGHLDVVSAEPESEWKYPPFSGKIAEGYLWGRGALDMKQTVIMNLAALLALKRAGIKPKRDLIFSGVADEEDGCKYGAIFLVNEYPDLIKAEYGLGEIGGFSMEMNGKRFYPVEIAEKGVCWFRIRAKGASGHGSIPNPESAAIKLAQAITLLGRRKLPYHLTPPAEEFIKALSRNMGGVKGAILKLLLNPLLADFIIDRIMPDKKLARTFWALTHNTANPTILRAGEKTNVVPSEASCEVDGRLLPGQTPENLMAEVRSVIGKDIVMEPIKTMQAAVQDVNDPVLGIFEKHIKEHDPEAIVMPYMIPGFTNGSQYARLGIKYFGFTPLRLQPGENFQELFHSANERVSIEGYKFGLRVFIETVWEMATEF